MGAAPTYLTAPGWRRRLIGGWAAGVAAGLALAAALPSASSGAAMGQIRVHDQATFDAAIASAQPGDTILLDDGSYPVLTVVRRPLAGMVTISGGRAARLAGFAVKASSNVTLRGVTITPGTQRANLSVTDSSSNLVFDGLLVDGRDERLGAGFATDGSSSDITIRNSEFTNCGWGTRCIDPTATRLVVENNRFHDCFDCDFVRGGTKGITIQGNSFDRAVPGICQGGAQHCPHNDHIQIMSGGPWTIRANRFGDRRGGAASIFVNPGMRNEGNPIQGVLIASNVFGGTAGAYGIHIGDNKGGNLGLMRDIAVVNNTILSGSITGLRINPGWAAADASRRPIVANNVFAILTQANCDSGRFRANLAVSGAACADGEVGPARLDANGAPTPESGFVVDLANPTYAPPVDLLGKPRKGTPDRGAIEFNGVLAPGARKLPPPPPKKDPRKKDPKKKDKDPKPYGNPKLEIVDFRPSRQNPAAGATFSVQFAVKRLDVGRNVEPDGVSCYLTVTGEPVKLVRQKVAEKPGSLCVWRLPADARGLRISGVVYAKVEAATVRRVFSYMIS